MGCLVANILIYATGRKYMPRMKILSTSEQEVFETPPVFNSVQRKQFFDFPASLLEISATLHKKTARISFLLSCGYFKATKRFFAPKDFHPRDIEYVARRLDLPADDFYLDDYSDRTQRRHRPRIVEFYGYREFDGRAEAQICQEIETMVRKQLKPKLIFWRCIDLLIHKRVHLPNYHKLSEMILGTLNQRKRELSSLIEHSVSRETCQLLDSLFIQEERGEGTSSHNARYRLTLLKKLSQSTKPTKINERVGDLAALNQLHQRVAHILTIIDIGHEGVRYYANSVIKSEVFQIRRRRDEDRYVHLIAFIAHQFYRLQDNLVDVLLTTVQSFQNSTKREHKEWCYEQRKEHNDTLAGFLKCLDSNIFGVLKQVRAIANDNNLNDVEKICTIQVLLKADNDDMYSAEDQLALLKQNLASEMSHDHYHEILASRSLRLQNRVSPVVKALDFQAETGAESLMEAIKHFKEKSGIVTQTAPLDFLDADQRKVVLDDTQKFRPSLYKAFLFIHIAHAIKSGNLNMEHAYKYRPLDDYVISRERWENEKEQLLEDAGMQEFADPEALLSKLDDALYQRYLHTNQNLGRTGSGYLKVVADGSFRVSTPKQEEKDDDSLQHLFPERCYVPLVEILSTVNRHCGFLEEFQHWQQRYNRSHLAQKTLYAGIMGLGCAIGTRKMAQISSMIDESELENTINWYFFLENVQAANDCVVRFMNQMELPSLYRQKQDTLHTASDGQKYEVRGESLNANYSFKYFGKGQGVSAYTFIDERNLLWYSLVFSAAERESAYVIDGLMRNDVIKSDIHSTDTHGYSEAIFAVTHLLGISYAPRIKNLKKQYLYIFKSRKKAVPDDWQIRPSKYANSDFVVQNWDDILRLIVTIKLKETTASDIFRRMNSYSKQHTLYKGLKAFGQIIKSIFILRYLDDVELRQAIEKQLNKVELANKFSRAVAIGNPREFKQTEKEEQEIAETCNRLIKNCIICWNYLYLSQKLEHADRQSREILLNAISSHSVISWAHINLFGEYDFSDEKLQDSVGIKPQKLAAFHHNNLGKTNRRKK